MDIQEKQVFSSVESLNDFIKKHGIIIRERWTHRKKDGEMYRVLIYEKDSIETFTAHQLDKESIEELLQASPRLKVGCFKDGGYILYRTWISPSTWEDVELGDSDSPDRKPLPFQDFIKDYNTLEVTSCYYPISDGGEKCLLLKNIWRQEVVVYNLNNLTVADIIKHTKELYVINSSCGYELVGYIPEKKEEELSDVWDFIGKVDEDSGKVYSIVKIHDNACAIVNETLPILNDKYYSWEKRNQTVLPNYYENKINENCSFVYKYYGFGLGIKRNIYLVLPCDYSYITNPINGWCFAIRRYSFVPGLTQWDNYYVLFWNIEKHNNYEFIPPTDYIVAADKLCKDEVEMLLSDGAFRLYIVGEDETDLKSFAIQKKHANIFLHSFLDLLHSPIDINDYIHSTYWVSKDNVEDIIHPRPKVVDDDPWKDYDLINDALDGDPDAYWNID